MYKIILLIGWLITITIQIPAFNLNLIPKSTGAMCMDGSRYGFYIFDPDQMTPAPSATPNKLLIYFQSIWQGWCVKPQLSTSISHCYQYISNQNFIQYGSSQDWSGSQFILNGILSSNSIFASWPKILVKNCDGGSYFSDTTVQFKNKTMNFKGKKNVIEMINLLVKKNFIQNREEILIVGELNGGIAALAWVDYIKMFTKAKVRVLLDAAVWENDLQVKTNSPLFQNQIKNIQKLFINTTSSNNSFPNQKCQQSNPDNLSKCFYSSQLIKHISSNIQVLFLQSYYDGWSISQILGLKCAGQFSSLSQCTASHRQSIQNYHKKIYTTLHNLIDTYPNVCAFGIACVAHEFTNNRFNDDSFSVPMGKNNTAENIVGKWLIGKNQKKYLDEVEWPENKQCARKAVNGANLKEE